MKHLFFTSGSTGQQKSTLIDEKSIMESAQQFTEIYGGEQGTVFNLIPSSPNIGYWIVYKYCNINDCDMVSLGMADPNIIAEFAKHYNPKYMVGLGKHIIPVLKAGNYPDLKYLIVIKGILPYLDEIKKLIPKGCKIFATYGMTELGMAWTTCDGAENGYHILDNGFTNEGRQLVYGDYKTGDEGDILDGKCPNCGRIGQRISTKIDRMDKSVEDYCCK